MLKVCQPPLAYWGRLCGMDEIDKAVAAVKRADQRLHAARSALRDAIREALAGGERQVDIARRTGYTREYIRRIARGDV